MIFSHQRFFESEEEDLKSVAFIDAYQEASNAYLLRQKDLVSLDELLALEAGFTKTLDGLRSHAEHVRVQVLIF